MEILGSLRIINLCLDKGDTISSYLEVYSINSTIQQLGIIIGTGISSFVIYFASINYVFYIDAITYVISAVCLVFMNYSYTDDSNLIVRNIKEVFKAYGSGISYLKKNKYVIYIIVLGFVPNFIVITFNSLLSSYTINDLGLGVRYYSFLDGSFAIGSLVAGILLSFIGNQIKGKITLFFTFIAMCISILFMGILKDYMLSIVSMFILGSTIMVSGVLIKTLLVNSVDSLYIGRVESFNWVLYTTISSLINLLMSYIANIIGNTTVFIVLAILIFLVYISSQKASNLLINNNLKD